MCVCVCVCVCVNMQSFFMLHPLVQRAKKKYFICTKVFTTDVLPSGFHLTTFYTAPVLVSIFVAWQHTACCSDGRDFATVNQHTHSVTTKQQLQGYKYSNYRMLPGITGPHSISFASPFLCVCVCVRACIEMLPQSSALFETDAI